jgi:hypothetical protein
MKTFGFLKAVCLTALSVTTGATVGNKPSGRQLIDRSDQLLNTRNFHYNQAGNLQEASNANASFKATVIMQPHFHMSNSEADIVSEL